MCDGARGIRSRLCHVRDANADANAQSLIEIVRETVRHTCSPFLGKSRLERYQETLGDVIF
jgi:hypothetical protein